MNHNHSTHIRGAVSEYRAASWYIERGFNVYWPAVHAGEVDFLIEKDGKYQRVQVKSAGWDGAYLRAVIHSKRSGGYTADSFDLLVIVYEERLWEIPWNGSGLPNRIRLAKRGDPGWRPPRAFDGTPYEITGETP